MQEPNVKCPIWGTPAVRLAQSGDGMKVRSPRVAGEYRISGTAAVVAQHKGPEAKARLTTWIVDQRRSGEAAPFVTDDVVRQAEARRPLRMTERKQRFFLLALSRNFQPTDSLKIGGSVDETYDRDIGAIAAWTECWEDRQVSGIVRLLGEEGFVHQVSGYVRLTAKGFERMEALESGAVPTTQAFVAMWFDESMDVVFDNGFDPAITDAGYRALRIDRKEHGNKVDDEIIAEIRRSRFVVADFTCETANIDGQAIAVARGGVYYEAGFAQGLGIPVIWSCRADCIAHVHFDTRQFNHIVWNDPADLRARLFNRIRAVIV